MYMLPNEWYSSHEVFNLVFYQEHPATEPLHVFVFALPDPYHVPAHYLAALAKTVNLICPLSESPEG